MATQQILKLDYIEGADASIPYISKEVSLTYPIEGLYYQMAWTDGVLGDFIFEVTIFPDKWESLSDCGDVKIAADGLEGHQILCIPQAWYLVSKMRFRFVPSENGSAGTFDVALRIIPK